jgi:hypothetical protein
MEDDFPGMWQRWLRSQSVGIGWPPDTENDFKLRESHESNGWNNARKPLQRIEEGDYVVVALSGNRVGRIGEVVGKEVEDDEWNPLVPPEVHPPTGEMGRRINVRWDLNAGPVSRDEVVKLPKGSRFTAGERRGTIREVKSMSVDQLKKVMADETNWVGLLGTFKYEKSISDFIAAYPHKLEEGLLPHPSKQIREKVFHDKTRADVLLIDKENIPVIVECKQNAPSINNIDQLNSYVSHLKNELAQVNEVRGLLVHGGSKKLHPTVTDYADESGIEVIQYSVGVNFNRSY